MVHPKNGLISKKRFNNASNQRNSISRFLTALNTKLLDSEPTVRVGYHLPKGADVVVRDASA
jgi:hypothetical protein